MLALVWSAMCVPLSAKAQDAGKPAKALAPLFAHRPPLAVRIEAPLTTLEDTRPTEEYLLGKFSYLDDDGKEVVLDLKLRSRGNFRLKETTCVFAPIRLNFQKKQVKGTEFDGQDKLKLVTHCQHTRPSYEQQVLREYFAYRILQLFTEKSFGVRLLDITYVDTDGGRERSKYGFVIEDKDDLGDRIGMKVVERGEISHEDLDADYENLINVYQYMIGNTDFSLVKGPEEDDCCHNAVLFSATGDAPYASIPYDFDFAGLVNAPYALPNPQFRLKNVRQRLYRGQCSNNELLPAAFQEFEAKRKDVFAIIDEMTMLSRNSRNSVTRYLKYFYRVIGDDEKIQRDFIEKCN
jgi:hypothetical protein